MSWISRHGDKVGLIGTVIAALCCIGTPALIAFLVAIGAGFLIHDVILLPLLVLFLGLAIWGLWKSKDRHQSRIPFAVGLAAAIVTLGSIGILVVGGVWVSIWMVYLGLAGLLAATALNIIFAYRRHLR